MLKQVCAVALALAACTSVAAQPKGATGMARYAPDTVFMSDSQALSNFADAVALYHDNSTPYYYRTLVEHRRGFDVSRAFGRCAVKMSPSRARDFLAGSGPYASANLRVERKYVTRLRGCAPAQLSVDRDFLRGAVAEHLIEADFPQALKSARDEAEMIAFLKSVEFDHTDSGDQVSLVRLGYQCRVAAIPVLGRLILQSEPGSDEEAELLGVLEDRTVACDPFFGDGDLSRFFARTFVSRALYDWYLFKSLPTA